MSHATHREIEIKLPATDLKSARRALRRAGFRVCRRRVFETNILFDTGGLSLRTAGAALRVREAGGVATFTYKGPATVTAYKSREELEVCVCDGAITATLLERLGFLPVFRYEKYRTEFMRPGSVCLAMLDETPIGVYLELEGEPLEIDSSAALLGFRPEEYVTASYARLYVEWCGRAGVAPTDMVFSPPQSRS